MGKVKLSKIGVLTSGGDAPGMNAAIRAVVRTCIYHKLQVVGIREGYHGLISGFFNPLDVYSVSNIISRGGTFLKSARCQQFYEKDGRDIAFQHCQSFGLDALVVIGGDGSFTGALQFAKEYQIPVIGIPGTIDNDIYGTDFSIGFDTAINTVVETVDKIRDTAASHNRVFFIEVMGHNAGFIALHAGIGSGAEEIFIPETHHDVEQLVDAIKRKENSRKKSSIFIVAEAGSPGRSVDYARLVEKQLPKADVKVTILGHVQRGGSPSCADRVLASRLGVAAIKALLEGRTQVMVGVKKNTICLTVLNKAISRQNQIPSELIEVSETITF